MAVTLVFWGSLLLVVYAYAGYPLLLVLLSLLVRKKVQSSESTPEVSFIITAHNEEAKIGAKIENTLQQAYPSERFEIIVASDCSSDATDAIVASYADRGVRLVRTVERKGKEDAQRAAVREARGEVLVFSDAATILEEQAVAQIVKSFSDPSIGCVSSVDRFLEVDGRRSGEGAYVKYEMALRRIESRVNTLVGLSGSFFAARKEVCRQWATDLPSDFNTLLSSVRLGMRGVLDTESVGYYRNLADARKEYRRKQRTVIRGISTLMRNKRLLNPFRYGLFAWQLFSHKLCRWLVPFGLLGAFVSNGVLASEPGTWRWILGLQVLFYLLAAAGAASRQLSAHTLFRIPLFFLTVNWSILTAWWRYLSGERMTTWKPSQR